MHETDPNKNPDDNEGYTKRVPTERVPGVTQVEITPEIPGGGLNIDIINGGLEILRREEEGDSSNSPKIRPTIH